MARQMQVIRMSGPGSDKISTEGLNGFQKQAMFCQALSRYLTEHIGPVVRPLPKSIDVATVTDTDGYVSVVLTPRF